MDCTPRLRLLKSRQLPFKFGNMEPKRITEILQLSALQLYTVYIDVHEFNVFHFYEHLTFVILIKPPDIFNHLHNYCSIS